MTINVDTCTKLLRTRVQFPAPPPFLKGNKMNIQDVKSGMKVRISTGECIKTYNHCSLCSPMLDLRGKVVIVSRVNRSDNIVEINGWDWHPEDLTDISKTTKKKKVEKVLFNEEELWV